MSNPKLKSICTQKYITAFLISIADKMRKVGVKDACFITILKGGPFFSIPLLRILSADLGESTFGFLGLSSYEEGTTSKEIRVTQDIDLKPEDANGRNVWILDDVLETGKTIEAAMKLIFRKYDVKSVRSAVLVKKVIQARVAPAALSSIYGYLYEGTKFLVGCGMGYGEQFRQLPYLCEVDVWK